MVPRPSVKNNLLRTLIPRRASPDPELENALNRGYDRIAILPDSGFFMGKIACFVVLGVIPLQ